MSRVITIKTAEKPQIGMTCNPFILGKYLVNDPSVMKEVVAGIQAALSGDGVKPTDRLGAAVFTDDNAQQCFASLFVGTVREGVKPGQAGYIQRNIYRRQDGTVVGDGKSIKLNLRFQKDQQAAQTGPVANPQALQQAIAALRAAGYHDQANALSGPQSAPTPAPAPAPQAHQPGLAELMQALGQSQPAPAPQAQAPTFDAETQAAMANLTGQPAPGNGTGGSPF